MEGDEPHTGDTTPSSESGELASSEDLEGSATNGTEFFHDSPDLPAGTMLMPEPQRRRIVPTRIEANPIAGNQQDELVGLVGTMARHTVQLEESTQGLVQYNAATLPPEDIERVLGRPQGQDSTLGLDRFESSIRVLAHRYGVPNTPLPPAGTAPQIFYPVLSMAGAGVHAAPMGIQQPPPQAGGYYMPTGAAQAAAAVHAAPTAPSAAPQVDGRPSPQGNGFERQDPSPEAPPIQVPTHTSPLVTGGSAFHLGPGYDPRVEYGSAQALPQDPYVWAPPAQNQSLQAPTATAQGQSDPMQAHPPPRRPTARRVAFSPSPVPPGSPSQPSATHHWAAAPQNFPGPAAVMGYGQEQVYHAAPIHPSTPGPWAPDGNHGIRYGPTSNPTHRSHRDLPTPGQGMQKPTVDLWQYSDRGKAFAQSLKGVTSDTIDPLIALEEVCGLLPGYVFFYHQHTWKKNMPTSIINLMGTYEEERPTLILPFIEAAKLKGYKAKEALEKAWGHAFRSETDMHDAVIYCVGIVTLCSHEKVAESKRHLGTLVKYLTCPHNEVEQLKYDLSTGAYRPVAELGVRRSAIANGLARLNYSANVFFIEAWRDLAICIVNDISSGADDMEPLIHLKEKFDIGDRSHELAQRTSPAPRESVDSYYQRYCAELQRIANIATMQNKGVEVSIEEIFDPYYLAYNFLKGTDPVLTRLGEKIFADPEKRSKYQMPFSFNDFRLDKMVQLIHLAERENRSLNDEASIFKLALNTPSKKGDKPQKPTSGKPEEEAKVTPKTIQVKGVGSFEGTTFQVLPHQGFKYWPKAAPASKEEVAKRRAAGVCLGCGHASHPSHHCPRARHDGQPWQSNHQPLDMNKYPEYKKELVKAKRSMLNIKKAEKKAAAEAAEMEKEAGNAPVAAPAPSSDTPAPPAAAPEEEEHPARAGKPGVTSNSAVIGYAAFERMMTGNPRPSTGCAIIVNRNTARPEDTATVENAQDQGKATKAEDPEDQEQIKTQSMDAAPKTDDESQSMEAAYEEARSAYRTIKLQVEKMDTLMKCQEDLALGHPKAQDRKGGEARDSSSPLRENGEGEAQDNSFSTAVPHTASHTYPISPPTHTSTGSKWGQGRGAVLGRATTDISLGACTKHDDRSDKILPQHCHAIPLNKKSDKILHSMRSPSTRSSVSLSV